MDPMEPDPTEPDPTEPDPIEPDPIEPEAMEPEAISPPADADLASPDPASSASTKVIAGAMIGLILCIALTTYLGIYMAKSQSIDLGTGTRDEVRVRYFDQEWQCTVWSPLAVVEGWIIGKPVRLLSGSILDRPATR